MTKTNAPQLSRGQSLDAKPIATPILQRTDLENGGQRVTIEIEPPRLTRILLRTGHTLKRKYELDPFGLEILQMCDGQKSVRYIAEHFAKKHKLDAHEAQQAVTHFLETMTRKGLIFIAVSKR